MVLNMAISKLSLKMNDKNTLEKLSYPVFFLKNCSLEPELAAQKNHNPDPQHWC